MIPAGLIVLESRSTAKTSMDILAAAVVDSGMTVLARIDHAAAAAEVGLDMRPTEVLIFGNPKAGTPIMLDAQTSGIDLPLKMLVWEDSEGKIWIGYNDPSWIGDRHGIHDQTKPVLGGMANKLAEMAAAAAAGK